MTYVTLLVRCKNRDNETVTDIYVELVSRPSARCMGV